MRFSLNKLLAAFGNPRAMERTDVDTNPEDIINAVKEKAFAVSKDNVLFASTKELGGYYYVITIIIGAFKIKTNKGATLNITGNDFNLDLNADTDEFESDHSNESNRYITRIDFQIEKEDVEKFDEKRIKSLKLVAKKHSIVFNTAQK